MEAAEHMKAAAAAVAGDEGSAGYNREPGSAAHIHLVPAGHKEESR